MKASLAMLIYLCAGAVPAAGSPVVSEVRVDAARAIAVVPAGLYGAGYDGWGDITDAQAVAHLQAVGITYCRMEVNLRELCGDQLGDWRWEYTTPRDGGLGFVSRLRRVIANGWTPILALTTSHALPRWFRGDPTDANGDPWFRRRLDGAAAPDEGSDQWAELRRVTHGLAAGLAERGLTGLHWETIYEIGHTMPMVDIHYQAAGGIREADPTAKLMGPATWPGWTVEERFVKPFLARHGADLLDFVTVHWYADNEHGLWAAPGWEQRQGPVTMANELFLRYLMETTPKYAAWCRSLRELLDDPALNPSRKRIGIAYTEFDALAESAYGRNPENPDWPDYRPDADCYLNTNYFGGVWCASALCRLAGSGAADIVCKFNTRQFYGLIDNAPGGGFYRQPVWFAWKLLRDVAGLKPGATMLATEVDGPTDGAAEHVGGTNSPWVEAYAVRRGQGLSLILINRSPRQQEVTLRLTNFPGRGTAARLPRYVYDRRRLARFIGRRPGTAQEGAFEGLPGDAPSAVCLEPLDQVTAPRRDGVVGPVGVRCSAVSITVLVAHDP